MLEVACREIGEGDDEMVYLATVAKIPVGGLLIETSTLAVTPP